MNSRLRAISRNDRDEDEEFLEEFPILGIKDHKEKLAKFKTQKDHLAEQYFDISQEYLRKLEANLPPEEIIISLKKTIAGKIRDLCKYRALSGLLAEEALDLAKLCLAFKPRRPEAKKKNLGLKLVKS